MRTGPKKWLAFHSTSPRAFPAALQCSIENIKAGPMVAINTLQRAVGTVSMRPQFWFTPIWKNLSLGIRKAKFIHQGVFYFIFNCLYGVKIKTQMNNSGQFAKHWFYFLRFFYRKKLFLKKKVWWFISFEKCKFCKVQNENKSSNLTQPIG